jgi:hypothetical protein
LTKRSLQQQFYLDARDLKRLERNSASFALHNDNDKLSERTHLTFNRPICSSEQSCAPHAFKTDWNDSLLRYVDVESELAAMKAEHDPLASHIFVSRQSYRNVSDTKSGRTPTQ